MPVTLRDIAQAAKVHETTVSKVLNGRAKQARISDRRARAILEAARKLGYRPNAAARAVSTGKFHTVALLQGTRPWSSQMPGETLSGICDALGRHEMHLVLARLSDSELTDPAYVPRILNEWMSDGLLINYHAGIPRRLVELVDDYVLPSVWINTHFERNCVHPDDLVAGSRLTEYLLGLGHRRIAYVDYSYCRTKAADNLHYSKVDRYEGYRRTMEAAGLPPWFVNDERLSEGEVFSHMHALVTSSQSPTAVLCYAPDAGNAIRHVAGQAGGWDPSALSIATFGPSQFCQPEMRLTQGVVPDREVGRRSVEMMLEKIRDPAEKRPAVAVPFGFEEGASTAPARPG